MLNLKLSIAQNESDQTSDRIKYVFAGKKQRREVVSGALPLGLKVENKHPVPDGNAPAVEYVFRFVERGGSMHGAMEALYEKFGIALTYGAIKRMLRNRSYIGEMYGIPDYAPAIISHDLFQRVKDRIRRYDKAVPVSGRVYIFSGLVVCPQCGGILSGMKGAANRDGEYKNFQYRCSRNMGKRMPGCHFTRSVFENKLEKYLLDNLQRLIEEHIVTIERCRAQQGADRPEARIEALKAKLSRLEDIYLDGMMDKQKYTSAYVAISQELSELTAQMSEAPSIPPTMTDIINDNTFLETYSNLSRESKQRFWKSLISRITFEDTPESRGKGKTIPFHVEFL